MITKSLVMVRSKSNCSMTSPVSLICGIALGDTKLPQSSVWKPIARRFCKNATFSSVGINGLMPCIASLGQSMICMFRLVGWAMLILCLNYSWVKLFYFGKLCYFKAHRNIIPGPPRIYYFIYPKSGSRVIGSGLFLVAFPDFIQSFFGFLIGQFLFARLDLVENFGCLFT